MHVWQILAAAIAIEHVGFFALEAVFFRKPLGRRVFALTPEQADTMAPLAANQGLYNGFLAAGLIWAIVAPPIEARHLATFFFACVLVAGLFGGATVKRSIWALQALPALIGLVTLFTG